MMISRISRMMAVLVCVVAWTSFPARGARVDLDLSGAGWRLWFEQKAKWENDELFPPPADMAKVPVNEPTGGWDALTSSAQPVSVPGTVEEYLKGNALQGDFKGVSWWVRKVKIPDASSPRRLLLRFD